MYQGKILRYFADREYGFLEGDDGLHLQSILNGTIPAAGMRVSYNMGVNKRDGRPRAIDLVELRSNAKPAPVRYGNDPVWK
jgi:hypothetical protein